MDYAAFDFIWQGTAGLGTPGTASGRGEGQESHQHLLVIGAKRLSGFDPKAIDAALAG